MSAKYSLYPEPTHKKPGLREFWDRNKNTIGAAIIFCCIILLLIMVGYAVSTGHLHMFSTEANIHEHLAEVVL